MSKVLILISVLALQYVYAGLLGRTMHGINYRSMDLGDFTDPEARYFEQDLDHFGDSAAKWQQRYYVNAEFFNGTGPVFIYIGGEGAESYRHLSSGHTVEMAATHGALLLGVEHRFYGKSHPTEDLSKENLHYLSSQQALGDLAHLYLTLRAELGASESNPVITFGGSYPGALSAWFRIKYPHIAFAAVASSAPMKAAEDFPGYIQVVAKSFANPIVGGSEKCLSAVTEAFEQFDALHQSDNIKELELEFNSCHPLEKKDLAVLAQSLADPFMGATQYNGQMAASSSIEYFCTQMTNTTYGTPMQRLKKLTGIGMTFTCHDFRESTLLAAFAEDSWAGTYGSGGMRQWIWQTCTQFGYYQTCERSEGACPFSELMDLQSSLDLCEKVFELSPEETTSRIQFSNEYYGSDHPEGSRILFVNGDIDPWHALSVTEDLPDDKDSIYILGASHCQDMHMTRRGDSTYLTEARKKIEAKVDHWINEFYTRKTAIA